MIVFLWLIIPFILLYLVLKEVTVKSFNRYVQGTSSKFVLYFLLFFGVILIFIPTIVTKNSILPLSYKDTGEIGDIIGGTTAPFIGFIGIIVTFYAFWVQYQSNIYQRGDIKLERFENQYYEMLRLHKENILEMEIGKAIKGRKCFVRMLYEYKFIYLTLYHLSEFHKTSLKKKYSKEQLSVVAYLVFFNGNDSIVANNSGIYNNGDMALLQLVYSRLREVQIAYQKKSKKEPEEKIKEEDSEAWFIFEEFYYPFDGHSTRLSHYYRHLFQTVSFIVDSDIVPDRLSKYRYLKLLRAQLSNHEQAMLYYNGLTAFGRKWINLGYFSDYRMIKNVPFNITNFGLTPKENITSPNKYGEIVFEWLE